jgi:cephalosporin hydroxylase
MRSERIDPAQWSTIDAFHRLYYEGKLVGDPLWLGMPIMKTPFDLWTYQEILWYTKPDVLLETGTGWGGSAYFFATIMDLLGHGQVITIDDVGDVPALYRWAYGEDCNLPHTDRPSHPRITYVPGHVLDPTIVAVCQQLTAGKYTMVALDSSHRLEFVRQELACYAPFVTPGCILVIEDTNIDGHPVQGYGHAGPYEAVQEFLETHPDFAIATGLCERYLMSYNTWLWRHDA